MSKHTKGPWIADVSGLPIVTAKNGQMKICDVRGWFHLTGKGRGSLGLSDVEAKAEMEANAILMASAPELLKALEHAVRIAENKQAGCWDDLMEYRALISEATGIKP